MKALFITLVLCFCFVASLSAQRNVFPIEVDTSQDGDFLFQEGDNIYHWYLVAPDSNFLALRIYAQRWNYYGLPNEAWGPIEVGWQWPTNVPTMLIFLTQELVETPGWYLLGKSWYGGQWVYYLSNITAMVGHYY